MVPVKQSTSWPCLKTNLALLQAPYYLQLMSLKACNLEPLVPAYYEPVTKGSHIFVTENTVKAYRKLQRCQGRKRGNGDAKDVKGLEGGEISWQKCQER